MTLGSLLCLWRQLETSHMACDIRANLCACLSPLELNWLKAEGDHKRTSIFSEAPTPIYSEPHAPRRWQPPLSVWESLFLSTSPPSGPYLFLHTSTNGELIYSHGGAFHSKVIRKGFFLFFHLFLVQVQNLPPHDGFP